MIRAGDVVKRECRKDETKTILLELAHISGPFPAV